MAGFLDSGERDDFKMSPTGPNPESETLHDLSRSMATVWDEMSKIRNFLSKWPPNEVISADGTRLLTLSQNIGVGETGDDISPLALYTDEEGRLRVNWGLINGLVPTNIDVDWEATPGTYVFARAGMDNTSSRMVTSCSLVKGSSATAHETGPFAAGVPPSDAYFLLGYVDGSGIIHNSGRGSLEFHVIVSHMYSDSSGLKVQYRIGVYRTG